MARLTSNGCLLFTETLLLADHKVSLFEFSTQHKSHAISNWQRRLRKMQYQCTAFFYFVFSCAGRTIDLRVVMKIQNLMELGVQEHCRPIVPLTVYHASGNTNYLRDGIMLCPLWSITGPVAALIERLMCSTQLTYLHNLKHLYLRSSRCVLS